MFFFAAAALPGLRQACGATVFISEFMAANTGFLRDADGDSPDWIEIFNSGATAVDLEGWSLTDDPLNPMKWVFPKTNLIAQGQLVVFASGKNQRVAGAELHANFSLDADGEYLGLYRPGTNLVSEFAPAFPKQVANVSFGASGEGLRVELLGTGSPVRIWVPAGAQPATNWAQLDFNDSAWMEATNGVGFETSSTNFTPWIRGDLRSSMFGLSSVCYLRASFIVTAPADLASWLAQLHYDDGCVVWLNGRELFRQNAPDPLAWNSTATAARANADVSIPDEIELGEFRDAIVAGTNVLAIQGLNVSADDPDFLLWPRLEAVSRTQLKSGWRYFPIPTPRKINNPGVEVLGPLIEDLSHSPNEPGDSQNLQVTVKVTPAMGPLKEVQLAYRVMFSNEVTTVLFDDGQHGDGQSGDGLFGALIPADASQPGEMVRYRVTALDTSDRASRWPPYFDPRGSAQYQGTVVTNLALTNPLPVVHWFVQNRTAAETSTGTRCSLSYAGEFYDNIFVRIRGGTSLGWPKHSYKIELNEGEHFRVLPGLARVSEFDLNTTYTDKSYNRAVLHYELQRDAEMPSPLTFHVRLQQNNTFFSVALYTEQPDTDFLRRVGLDEQGALYKGGPGSTYDGTSSFEKKTRRNENRADLQALINGLRLTGAVLENYVFDNIDLPGMVNYMATVAIAQNIDGSDKNHFLYRDTRGSGEWFMLPWDLDLSFGPNALNTDTMVYNQNYTSHPFIGVRPYLLHDGKYNRLLEAIYKVPRAREMVVRRVRTLTEQFLDSGYFSNRIDRLIPLLTRDVDLDKARWRGNTHFPGTNYTLQAANDRIKTNYLSRRGGYLKSKTIPGITTNNVDSQPPDVPLAFGQLDFNPPGGNQAQEYIELKNTNAFPVELTGWRITGSISHRFKPATVIPSTNSLFLTADAAAFRSRTNFYPKGGQGLFVQGGYAGRLSARGGQLRLLDQNGREVAALEYSGAPSLPQQFLRVSELMFHPALLRGDTFDAEEFEYVALRNTGNQPLDLAGVRFARGIDFDFTSAQVTNLPAGQTVYLVKNRQAFQARYGPGLPIAGEYTGQLDNSGETLALFDASNETVLEFRYEDKWLEAADGQGPSLAITDLNASHETWTNRMAWTASSSPYGMAALFDGDGDAISNFYEIIAGTDPAQAASKPGFESLRFDNAQVRLRFRAVAGRQYRIQFNDSIASPLWTTIRDIPSLPADRTEEVLDGSPAGQSRFYRLQVWR